MPHVLFPAIPTERYEGNLPVSLFVFRFLASYLPSAVGWGTALQIGKWEVRFPVVSLEFFIDIILPAALCPGVDSASNRNEYQEYFLVGGKGGRCLGLTMLPPSCADCLEIWEPQLPGTLRARSGLFRDCFTVTYLPKYLSASQPTDVPTYLPISLASRLTYRLAYLNLTPLSIYSAFIESVDNQVDLRKTEINICGCQRHTNFLPPPKNSIQLKSDSFCYRPRHTRQLYVLNCRHACVIIFFPLALRPSAGYGLPIHEVSWSHTTTHHSR